MKEIHHITAEAFCSFHNIEITFLHHLDEYGLITLEKSGHDLYIYEDQLQGLERMVRLYVDLGINIDGIETIIHLLERTESLENEIIMLKNRLSLYEDLQTS